MNDKGYIFISHAHQDVELVRRIRNHFEELGLEPILFYLKCLTDNDEITDLIKREIGERDWFVYADSPNARESKWVRMELDEIRKYSDKLFFTIDLDSDIEEQLRQVEHIARQSKVFISYPRRAGSIAQKLRNAFLKKDMQVWIDIDDLRTGESFHDQINTGIQTASHDGFVILVVTDETKHSRWIMEEIKLAIDARGKIVPVYIGDAALPEDYLSLLGEHQGFRLQESPSEEEIENVVSGILHRVEYYGNDFTSQFSYRSAEIIHLPEIAVIDELTFFDCSNLKKVYIPKSVVYISENAFDDLPGIKVISEGNQYVCDYCLRHGIDCEVENKYE